MYSIDLAKWDRFFISADCPALTPASPLLAGRKLGETGEELVVPSA